MRLWMIAMMTQYLMDPYLGGHNMQEFWQPARYLYPGGLDYDIHKPYTDTFNQIMVRQWSTLVDGPHLEPEKGKKMRIL